MKTFKEYLQEAELPLERKYVAVYYDEDTQKKLRDYCQRHGFSLEFDYDGNPQSPEDFEFHTTVFYTTTEHRISDSNKQIDSGTVIATGFELFGKEKDVPVMKLESDGLLELRQYFIDRYDMKDEWPDYRPHISLSYARTNLPDLSTVPLPDFELVYDTLKIDSLK